MFTLGEIKGHAQRVLALAASMKSADEALAAYHRLIARSGRLVEDTERYYRDYLANTIELSLPDAHLQQAYDWSRISVVKGFVDNPFLGRGLVAGYGPSKGAYRPGFAWFFGRDSFWTSLALTSAGDFANARAAIQFISHFQRDDGKIPHEISQSASLVDWFKQYPYGFASADATPLYAIATADYVRASGDAAFAREQAPRLWKALAFMRSTLDEAGFPQKSARRSRMGRGWTVAPVRVELYQAACYVEALRSLAKLAGLLGDEQRAQVFERSSSRSGARFIVHQRRGVNDLHHGAQFDGALAGVVHQLGGEQQQGGAQAFATATRISPISVIALTPDTMRANSRSIAADRRAGGRRLPWRSSLRSCCIAGGVDKGGYVATCAEVEIDGATKKVRIRRVVQAWECGAVINPDGLKNQLSGAIVQGIGGALFEKILFADGRILNPHFAQYRVPRFSDTPKIEVVLLDRKDLPSAGAGETGLVGLAPAVGNAIFAATGSRPRSMPMAPENS